MKLQVHSIHFDADKKLVDFLQKKIDKLETFYDRIIDGEVYLRLEKNGAKENKITQLKINIPGHSLFAKEQAESFEAAADKAIEGIRRQLKRQKEKMYSQN